MKTLFVGVECEGPLKGKKTLFVQGKVPIVHIHSAIHSHHPEQVYFGAGRLTEINFDDMTHILESTTLLVTAETVEDCSKYLEKYNRFYHMLTMYMPLVARTPIDPFDCSRETLDNYLLYLECEAKERVLIKNDTGHNTVISSLWSCNVNDYSEYNKDVTIWEE